MNEVMWVETAYSVSETSYSRTHSTTSKS